MSNASNSKKHSLLAPKATMDMSRLHQAYDRG
jgi:hypothetical protein